MTKICYVITSLSVGGAEGMLLRLVSNLDRSLYKVSVISLTDLGSIAGSMREIGIEVLNVGMKPGALSISNVLKLSNLIRKIQPDIVHTWMYHADLVGGIAARLAGIKTIIWCIRHGNVSLQVNPLSRVVLIRLCALLSWIIPVAIITCSLPTLHEHAKIGYRRNRMSTIHNGYEIDGLLFDQNTRDLVRTKLGIDRNCLVVGTVGRFDRQKNHFGFLEAATYIGKHSRRVLFVMAGRNVDQGNTDLVDRVRFLGLENKTLLLGAWDNISSLLSIMDVFVSPSLGEGFPNIIAEAMCSGVPCVVTDVGASAEIVGDIGIVVPPNDAHAIGRAMERFLGIGEAERSHMRERSVKRMRELFSIQEIVSRYSDMYARVLEKGNFP